MQPRAALSEAQGLVSAALHLPHHEDPERQQQNERYGIDQQGHPAGSRVLLNRDGNALLPQKIVNRRIIGRDIGAEAAAVSRVVLALNVARRTIDGDLLDLTLFHGLHQLREGGCILNARPSRMNNCPQ